MKNLPRDWYEQSMQPLREEAKTWPEWMRAGAREADELARLRNEKYLPPKSDDEERPL
jgi:hypothetical protein